MWVHQYEVNINAMRVEGSYLTILFSCNWHTVFLALISSNTNTNATKDECKDTLQEKSSDDD